MERVKEILKKIELDNDIKILFAVDGGSRAYKLDHIDSDYDIRFVFRHNDTKKYTSIRQHVDNYCGFSDDKKYDWQGWDIKKALLLLHKMNPSIVEWLHSSIIYYKCDELDVYSLLKQALMKHNRPITLLYHYKYYTKESFINLEGMYKEKVPCKKYLDVIRSAIMFRFIWDKCWDNMNMFDIDFFVLLKYIKECTDIDCWKHVCDIVDKKKMNCQELTTRIKCIDDLIRDVVESAKKIGDNVEITKMLKIVEKGEYNKEASVELLDEILQQVLAI